VGVFHHASQLDFRDAVERINGGIGSGFFHGSFLFDRESGHLWLA